MRRVAPPWGYEDLANLTIAEIRSSYDAWVASVASRHDLSFVGAYLVAHRDQRAYPELVLSNAPDAAFEPVPLRAFEREGGLRALLHPVLGGAAKEAVSERILVRGREQGRVVASSERLRQPEVREALAALASQLALVWTAYGTLRNSLESKLENPTLAPRKARDAGAWNQAAARSIRWLSSETKLRSAVARIDFAHDKLRLVAGSSTSILPDVELPDLIKQRKPYMYALRRGPRSANLAIPMFRFTDGRLFGFLFCSAVFRKDRPYLTASDVRFCRWIEDELARRHQTLRQQQRIEIVLEVLAKASTVRGDTSHIVADGIQEALESACSHIMAEDGFTELASTHQSDEAALTVPPSTDRRDKRRNPATDGSHSRYESWLVVGGGDENRRLSAWSFAQFPHAFHAAEEWAVKALLDHLALVQLSNERQARLEETQDALEGTRKELSFERDRIALAAQAIQSIHFAKNSCAQLGSNLNEISAAVTTVGNTKARSRLRASVTKSQAQLMSLTRNVEAIRLQTPEDTTIVDVRDIVREVARTPVSLPGELPVLPNAEPTPELRVLAPKRTLLFIVENLVRNAAEAGARSILVGARKEASEGGLLVRFYVRDNGEPIPKGLKDLLWQATFTTKQRGSGLGLADTKRFAESRGGRVGFKPEPGWKTFWFELPLWESPGE